jgi:hypothetical protein
MLDFPSGSTMRRASAYRVFVTRNSEYHVRGLVCCGVRDRRSGRWVRDHWAINHALATAFRDATGRMRTLATPVVGESLQFVVGERGIVTSPILSVEEREGLELGKRGGAIEALRVRRRTSDPRETI